MHHSSSSPGLGLRLGPNHSVKPCFLWHIQKPVGVPTSVSSLVPRQKVMKMIPTLTKSCDGSHSKRITGSCFAL